MRWGFVVTRGGEATSIEISPELDAAMDLLTDDGFPIGEAAKLLVAAEMDGKNPEHFARHFLRLRRAFREAEARP